MRRVYVVFLCFICIADILTVGCAMRPKTLPEQKWARPCDIDCVNNISNFAKVTDKLWRGSKPEWDRPGVLEYVQKKVRTIINLQHDHDDFPKLQATNIRYLWIPMRAWKPEVGQLVIFLSALRKALPDPNQWPVFVHCLEGRDRTGYAIATYRIIEEKWKADDAILEMFDFHYNWWNPFLSCNPDFLRNVEMKRNDIEARVSRAP